MATNAAVETFRADLRGELLQPGDGGYDEARKVYNAMIDRRPGLIARCADAADVMRAVRFGQEKDVRVAVRGGAHNGPGLGSCDDGLVIDLGPMKGIRVDPEARTVRVGPGCTQGEVAHAAHAFGLTVPAGIVSTTGIAGLTLGGGHGYLSRSCGLTVDNLLEADVVLADGTPVVASEREHPDLFWALRGGGGNFGIVTSFRYRAHPVDTVYMAMMFWSLQDAPRVMRWYREFQPQAPRELSGFFGLQKVPPTEPFPEEIWGKLTCATLWCYKGTADRGEEALRAVGTLPKPLFEHAGPVPFPALQSLFDPLLPPGLQWYWKGDFVQGLSDEAIDAHLQHAERIPTPLSLMHLYPIDGAVHDVPRDATAWSCRDATWSMVIVGIGPEPQHAESITRWAKEYWNAIHPYSAGAAYVNFMMLEGEERVRATYGPNYDRLREVKKKYDPANFFRVNQNIPPA